MVSAWSLRLFVVLEHMFFVWGRTFVVLAQTFLLFGTDICYLAQTIPVTALDFHCQLGQYTWALLILTK